MDPSLYNGDIFRYEVFRCICPREASGKRDGQGHGGSIDHADLAKFGFRPYYRKGRDFKSLLNPRGNENTLCYPVVCFNSLREAIEQETGGWAVQALGPINISFSKVIYSNFTGARLFILRSIQLCL